MDAPNPKRPRADGQMSALAGELFVAAELLRREIQTSITFGNAKAIDLFARNSRTGRTFTVQVKAARASPFLISPKKVQREHVYVFVLLNAPGKAIQHFVVQGRMLADEPERFGRGFQYTKAPSIAVKDLIAFSDAWSVFEEPA